MKSLNTCMIEYIKLLAKGEISIAYKGLMQFMSNLRNHFEVNYPDYRVSGSIYQGYMDMTYFALIPDFLGNKKLKIAVVFIHEEGTFKIWLAGVNRKIQSQYGKLVKELDWNQYRISHNPEKTDFIIEQTLLTAPDFDNLEVLQRQIEQETLAFIENIRCFLERVAG